jgi:hypothetical protein
MDRSPSTYEAFDLGGTLVAIENDEISRDATGHVTLRDGGEVLWTR